MNSPLTFEVLRDRGGLTRLEESRLVKARWRVITKNRRARVYEMTAAGRRHLETKEKRWRKVTLAVGQLLEQI